MKTNNLARKFLGLAALTLGTAIAIPSTVAAPATTTGNVSTPNARACTDARLVTVREIKPSLHNGRGPQITTQVGKKLECTSCDTPMVAMKPSGHNGRGAMAPVEIKGRHDCSKNGCGPAVAVVN